MSSVLVFGPVGSIGEGFVTAFVFTHIRFLSSMRAQVSLQVFQTRVGLITAFKLQHKTQNSLQTQNAATATLDQQYFSNYNNSFDELWSTHSALVRLLSRVSAHMNHQHVLGFKWSLFP